MDKNQIDNQYIDLNELFKDFTKYLEIYDLNLLSIYINNTDKDKLQFSQKMFLNLKNKINSLKYLNANNRKLFQDRIDNISNYLNNNSLNFVNENLIIRNQRKNSKNYGIFLQEKGKNCSSCFKMANDETSDAEIISLNFCNHEFCRECLRNYVLKSTNNLVFLKRSDEANSNRRVLKCLTKECEFILFIDDYYKIFGSDQFDIIKNNYECRPVKSKKSLFCLLCGTYNLKDCYFCPKNSDPKKDECHCVCQNCSTLYYKSCRKVNNDSTILGFLPCPLPFCNADWISIKEKILSKKINNIELYRSNNNQRKEPQNKQNDRRESTIIRKLLPKPITRNKFCICAVDDEELLFSDDFICQKNHYMHNDCIISYLNAQISEKIGKNYQQIIQCPYSEEGNHLLNSDYIQSLLFHFGEEKLVKTLLEINLNENSFLFECLNLNCLLKFVPIKNDDSTIFTCFNCCSSYCFLCQKFAHNKIKCEGESREDFLSLGFMSCPYCYELFAKDDKCNHVKCNKCLNDFCFRCSAKRNPILYHGNHYHRSFCPDYFLYDKNDNFHQKCQSCLGIKSITGTENCCPRPGLLDKNGDIPEKEREFNDTYLPKAKIKN